MPCKCHVIDHFCHVRGKNKPFFGLQVSNSSEMFIFPQQIQKLIDLIFKKFKITTFNDTKCKKNLAIARFILKI